MGSRTRQRRSSTVSRVTHPPELISAETISRRVRSLAADVDAFYAGTDRLVLIGVLKGSFIFLSDLARHLTVPHRIEFIAVTSYGALESEHADPVRLIMDVRHGIDGEDVLIVEDIVDTGHTLAYLMRLFSARNPRSLRTCTLLHKPERTERDITIDFLGFTIPDVWVVGYGLDYAERYRTLPYLAELPPELR